MNFHNILRNHGYTKRSDYPDIARWAAANTANFRDEGSLLNAVENQFGAGIPKCGMRAQPQSYQLWTNPSLPLDENAVEQLEIALKLPVAVGGAGMPDLHKGYSLPIGGVVALNHAVSPAFVGYDISCMMMLTIFDTPEKLGPAALEKAEVREAYLQWVLASTSFGLGAKSLGADHAVMDDERWSTINFLHSLKDLAFNQLGSSGAGNHFADIVSGRYIDDAGEFVGLLTHSGSRGAGNKIGHHYAKLADRAASDNNSFPEGYGWLELDSTEGQEYLQAMQLMGDYARANHELIHTHFAQESGLETVIRYANKHNFAWVDEQGRVIHRKGATPAEDGQMGIIPGSSGSESYLVIGKGNAQAWNSASHGAGRPFSRSEAKKRFVAQSFETHMREKGITHYGIAADETVSAYKDIHCVINAQADLIDVVAIMQPRVVVMGGNLKSDDGD
jgi:tRNA-splicing ligase RtcB